MYLICDKMRPEKTFFIYFIPRYVHFKILALPSTPGSGTAYILMGKGLKFWYFMWLGTEELYLSNLFE